MESFRDIPILLFESQQHWHEWLDKNYAQKQGIWIKIAKKNSGVRSITYMEALDDALCYGWIDGQLQRYDDNYYLQKFTPRRLRSIWSKANVAKVKALTKNGKMQPAGLAAIELAKQNGEYERAYDSTSETSIPRDFQAALDRNPQ